MTSGHEWHNETDGGRACRKCPVRTYAGHWQHKKGTRWRSVGREPVPACIGTRHGLNPDTSTLLLKAWMALDGLPTNIKQATEAETTMHNIKSLLVEHGVKVPR